MPQFPLTGKHSVWLLALAVSIGCVLVLSFGECLRKVPVERSSHYTDKERNVMRGHDGVEILIQIYGTPK